MRFMTVFTCLFAVSLTSALGETAPHVVDNVIVYKEDGKFGGWPANNGVWSWGDEIVAGFIVGGFDPDTTGHLISSTEPTVHHYARSLDGGETWSVTPAPYQDEYGNEEEPQPCPGDIDFTDPDFALKFRYVSASRGFSWFYLSDDRCHTWQGPYEFPTFDRPIISARTDYLVNGPSDLTAFMTSGKDDGNEGRVFSARTRDGGATWEFVTWIGPEPDGFSIMPTTVRLSETEIYTGLRRKEGDTHWIDGYLSVDNGETWRLINRPAESTGGTFGNPGSMIELADGRLAIVYGYRSPPYGMRARLSEDRGRTWGEEIMLRDDAGSWDLGYPQSVQREDGNIVSIYYFNEDDEERYIAATIWNPGDPGAAQP